MDVKESLLGAARERLASPVAGSFVIIWIVVNWQFVLVLLLDPREIVERIEFVLSNYSSRWLLLDLPLILTLLFHLAHPYLILGAFIIAEKANVWRRQIEHKLQTGKPFSPEEKRAVEAELAALKSERDELYKQMTDMRRQHFENVATTEETIEALKRLEPDDGNDVKELIASLESQVKETRNQLNQIRHRETLSRRREEIPRGAPLGIESNPRDVYEYLGRSFGGVKILKWVAESEGLDASDLKEAERKLWQEAVSYGLVKPGSQIVIVSDLGKEVLRYFTSLHVTDS